MPIRNLRHGLYVRDVPITASLPTPLRAPQLASYFKGMAEACLLLAERLDAWSGGSNGQIGNVISNLSRLSSDLEQFSAVLSVNALRPSPLSNLPSEDIEQLIAQQRRALELALSRIALTCGALLAGEPLRANGTGITAYRELATLMRRSKSIAQALATNLYWQQRMQDAYEDDLSARLYAAILGKESKP
jgi:hypothetical protein